MPAVSFQDSKSCACLRRRSHTVSAPEEVGAGVDVAEEVALSVAVAGAELELLSAVEEPLAELAGTGVASRPHPCAAVVTLFP